MMMTEGLNKPVV